MCLAIPAQVDEILDDQQRFATLNILGVRRRANIELLVDDPPAVGEWVLVHVGFAMSKISADQAEAQLRLLEMLGESSEVTAEPSEDSSDPLP